MIKKRIELIILLLGFYLLVIWSLFITLFPALFWGIILSYELTTSEFFTNFRNITLISLGFNPTFVNISIYILINFFLSAWWFSELNKDAEEKRKGTFFWANENYIAPHEIRLTKLREFANEIDANIKEIEAIEEKQIANKKEAQSNKLAKQKQKATLANLNEQAGRQKLFQYLGDIRKAIEKIENGEDNRLPKQMAHDYLDAICSDYTITEQHKLLSEAKNYAKLLLIELEELGLKRDMLSKRIKDIFNI